MELGLVPGTVVRVVRVAPLGDPIELSARGCELSIRKSEARSVTVAQTSEAPARALMAEAIPRPSRLPASS
jgi:hypothetical protein